jgi:hypothetical protein
MPTVEEKSRDLTAQPSRRAGDHDHSNFLRMVVTAVFTIATIAADRVPKQAKS